MPRPACRVAQCRREGQRWPSPAWSSRTWVRGCGQQSPRRGTLAALKGLMVGVGRGRGPLLTLQVGSSASGPAARTGPSPFVTTPAALYTGAATCAPGKQSLMQHVWIGPGKCRPARLLLRVAVVSGLIRYCFACVFAMFLFPKGTGQPQHLCGI